MPLLSGQVQQSSLLEREREVGALQTALGEARAGSGRVVVVGGSAGCGRTALLGAAAEEARRRRMTVLGAAGDPAEQTYRYALVLQLLEGAVGGATDSERADLFAGPAAPAAELFGTGHLDPGFDAVHGIYRLLVNVSRNAPLAVLVDDVQWGDEPSLLALGYLARRIGELPVTLVLGVRDGEPGAGDAVVELAADTVSSVLRPQPLGTAAVGELTRRRLGTDQAGAAVARVTAGNPLLVGALLAAPDPAAVAADPVGRVPEPLVRWVRRRLDPLGVEALAFARALAVLGDDARLDHVAHLAELDATTAEAAADTLGALGLTTAADRIGFTQPIVRAAVHETIPAAAGRQAHARAARLLRRAGAPPAVVADQLLRAPVMDARWSVRLLRAEAAKALAAGDLGHAEALIGRALDEPVDAAVRGALLAQLGELRAGRSAAEAVELLDRALELLTGRTARVDAHRALADALVAGGRHRRADKVIRAGLALAGGAEPELTRRLQASQVLLGAVRPEFEVEADVARLPARTDPVLTVAERTELVAAAARGCFELEPHGDCLARARQALDGERLDAGDGPDAHRWAVAKAVLVWADDLPGALAVCDNALVRLRRRGNAIGVATARGCRATPAFWSGRLDEATADAEGALAEREAGWQPWFGLAGTVLVACHLERGDRDTAAAVLAEVQERAGDAPEFVAYARFARAQLRVADGDLAGALEDFVAAGTAMPHPNPAALPWRSQAALVAAQLGDHARAGDLADAEVELAQRFGAARPIGLALRAAGVVATDPATGRALLAEAVDVLRTSAARLELARALCDLGDATLACGEELAAREPLREALGLADDAGATVLVRRARQALVRAGGRPRRAAHSGRKALTASERRVAELAADGLSNREIAERLVVARKTVAFHLSSVYRKLGVTSRAELKPLMR